MEVILLERVGRLGTVGDVVKVKDGYGRNFLLPQKKALRATADNKAVFDARRAEIEAANAAAREVAKKQAETLGKASVVLVRQASEDGKLYGSVTVRDIAEGLKEQGSVIERKQLVLSATIKNTGTFTAQIVLHPEVIVPLSVVVVRNESDVEAAVAAEDAAALLEHPEEITGETETTAA